MIVNNLLELTINSVIKRGTPNEECFAIQVNQNINLGQYGIMLGQYSGGNSAVPFRDNLFWFNDGIVKSGDWLFIYTGSGTPTQTKAANGINDLYSLFWGKPHTVLIDTNIVPMLFRVDAVNVAQPPVNLPQLG